MADKLTGAANGANGNGNGNGVTRTFVTALVSALVGALLMMMLNAKANDVTLARAVADIQDLQKRALLTEQNQAQDHATLGGLVSKVDDMWNVIVLGRQPTKR
jgi:hypothetical protein